MVFYKSVIALTLILKCAATSVWIYKNTLLQSVLWLVYIFLQTLNFSFCFWYRGKKVSIRRNTFHQHSHSHKATSWIPDIWNENLSQTCLKYFPKTFYMWDKNFKMNIHYLCFTSWISISDRSNLRPETMYLQTWWDAISWTADILVTSCKKCINGFHSGKEQCICEYLELSWWETWCRLSKEEQQLRNLKWIFWFWKYSIMVFRRKNLV